MSTVDALLRAEHPFLSDGGLETFLVFLEGVELPAFAAIALLEDPAALRRVERYFEPFLAAAAAAKTGFVMDTITWRGGLDWGPAIGRDRETMARLNIEAVGLAQRIALRWADRIPAIVLNGVVGPAGDGYAPERELGAAEAERTHAPQIAALREGGAQMISAVTMTHVGEAVGIVAAAASAGAPVVVSYTVETDGRLPNGQALGAAIEETDARTGGAPLYYMINCAHPDHFRGALAMGAPWLRRIGGLRANASRLSHAELDASETLDDGDPEEFGRLHAALTARLPNLRMVGGCCGTDHRHIACVAQHLHRSAAA